MSKIVTICGSMKFQKEMIETVAKLELEYNYMVIQCVYFSDDKKLTTDDLTKLNKLHRQKINLSDAIYVVNVGGYIGSSTKEEIEYAKSLGKEILSLEPLAQSSSQKL